MEAARSLQLVKYIAAVMPFLVNIVTIIKTAKIFEKNKQIVAVH